MQDTQQWKTVLQNGRPLRFKVTSRELYPRLNAGDEVTVRSAHMQQIRVGDIVLCQVASQVRLREVRNIRTLHGVPCIEVTLGDRSVVSRFVQESAVLGKVMHVRGAGHAAVPVVKTSWWSSATTLLGQFMRGAA